MLQLIILDPYQGGSGAKNKKIQTIKGVLIEKIVDKIISVWVRLKELVQPYLRLKYN